MIVRRVVTATTTQCYHENDVPKVEVHISPATDTLISPPPTQENRYDYEQVTTSSSYQHDERYQTQYSNQQQDEYGYQRRDSASAYSQSSMGRGARSGDTLDQRSEGHGSMHNSRGGGATTTQQSHYSRHNESMTQSTHNQSYEMQQQQEASMHDHSIHDQSFGLVQQGDEYVMEEMISALESANVAASATDGASASAAAGASVAVSAAASSSAANAYHHEEAWEKEMMITTEGQSSIQGKRDAL